MARDKPDNDSSERRLESTSHRKQDIVWVKGFAMVAAVLSLIATIQLFSYFGASPITIEKDMIKIENQSVPIDVPKFDYMKGLLILGFFLFVPILMYYFFCEIIRS